LYSAGNAWSCGPFGGRRAPVATGTRRLAGPRREAQVSWGAGRTQAMGASEIAKAMGISRASVYRAL
jgi:hypothetical protein